jgi:hypothetical protein
MTRILIRTAFAAVLLAGLGTLVLFRAMMDHNNQGEFFDTTSGAVDYEYVILVASANFLFIFLSLFMIITSGVLMVRTLLRRRAK